MAITRPLRTGTAARRPGRRRLRATSLALVAANAAAILTACGPAITPAAPASRGSNAAKAPAVQASAVSAVQPGATAIATSAPAAPPAPVAAVASAVSAVETRAAAGSQVVAVAHAAPLPAASAALIDARALLVDGDYKKAQQNFASIAATYPGTPEAAEALLRQGEALLADDQFSAAENALRRFVNGNPGHPLFGTALMLLGRAYEGESNGGAATNAYARYVASVDPDVALGDFLHLRSATIYFDAGRATDGWTELSLAVHDADASGSSAAKVRVYDALGARYMEAGNRTQAIGAWQVALDSAVAAKQPARDLAPMAWRLVGAYQAAGQRDQANAMRGRIIAEWPTTFNALQAMNDLGPDTVPPIVRGQIYFSNRRWRQAADTLYDYITGGAPDGRLAEARYMRAIALTRLGDDQALDALDRVADLHGDSQWAPEALWEAGSLLLRKGDQPAALNRFERLAVGYPQSEWRGQALYWLGKLLPTLGNPAAGQRYMEAAAVNGYEDFYTFRARAALKRPAPVQKSLDDQEQITLVERAAWDQWLAAHGRTPDEQAQVRSQIESDVRYKRGLALLDGGFQKAGEAELGDLLGSYPNDLLVLGDVALAVRDEGDYSYAMTLGHRMLDQLEQMGEPSLLSAPRMVQKLVLPLAFIKLVAPAAEAKKMDPLLLLGLMKQESWFQPRAASSAQARGLTQFIYDTAKSVATELNWPDWTWDDMQKPYVSVPFGAHYLSSLIRDFRGNYYFAIAGYNGGPGNVLTWAKGDWNRDVDLFVEGIGYSETRNYVKAVAGNYELYKAIYYR